MMTFFMRPFHPRLSVRRHRKRAWLRVMRAGAFSLTLVLVPAVVVAATAAGPSVVCKSAPANTPDATVCGSPLLTRLDRELQRLYELATAPETGASARMVSDGQRAWLAERDGCMRDADAAACMRELYLERIAAVRSESAPARGGGRGASLGPFEFRCPGTTPRIIRITYANVNPSLAVIAMDGKFYVLSQARSASGGRYEGQGALFWEHQGEARWRAAADGIESTCKRITPLATNSQ